ncbi:hypothetical protein D9758_014530 [Tetrapyrgos nigripes]|uniref:Uncharacterized protein n=1 Tax=Tetrapyrgos nigripes TaxID=182062 RepID=A0A8H5CTU5_9AGAR|nr:hypothetical protein D9758_014530 [Tetrapyrgos nigripes]
MAQIFSDARDCSFSNSSISCMTGDQNIVYGSQTVINHSYGGRRRNRDEDDYDGDAEEVEARRKRSRLKALMDDFREFKRGDTMVLELISGKNSEFNNMRARRRIEAVKIFSNETRNEKFTSVTFEGTEAQEMWKDTFEEFSRIRSANSWQLFGFTRSQSYPSLIFHYEEHVSFNSVYSRASPIVKVFLLYRLKADVDHLRDTMDVLMFTSEAWVVPEKPTLNYGPPEEGSEGVDDDDYPYFHSISVLKPFPGFWREEAVIAYLDTAAVEFHGLLTDAGTGFYDEVSFCDCDHTDIMPLGQLFLTNRGSAVGGIPLTPTWSKIRQWFKVGQGSEDVDCSAVIMQNGWTRVYHPCNQYMKNPSLKESIEFRAVVEMTEESRKFLLSSWYSQAPWVFKQIGLDMYQHGRDLWICDSIESQITLHGHDSLLLPKDIFVFLPPIEQVGAASFCLKGDPFLSYDECGETRIGCSRDDLLGLVSPIQRWCFGCMLRGRDPLPYIASSYYQRLKGYNPDTNAYAAAHGFPIFQFAPNFKEIIINFVKKMGCYEKTKINPDGGKDGFLLPLLDGHASHSRIEEVDEEVEVEEYLTTETEVIF